MLELNTPDQLEHTSLAIKKATIRHGKVSEPENNRNTFSLKVPVLKLF